MRYYLDTEFIERPLCLERTSHTIEVPARLATGHPEEQERGLKAVGTSVRKVLPTIDLLSLAIVREDGEELYVTNRDADWWYANAFVREKVLPRLGHPDHRHALPGVGVLSLTPYEIAERVKAFVGADDRPVFYGYYADYDWVVFCWLFGTMIDLPRGFPMYCRDLKQMVDEIRDSVGLDLASEVVQPENEHNALVDARFNKRLHEHLIQWSLGRSG